MRVCTSAARRICTRQGLAPRSSKESCNRSSAKTEARARPPPPTTPLVSFDVGPEERSAIRGEPGDEDNIDDVKGEDDVGKDDVDDDDGEVKAEEEDEEAEEDDEEAEEEEESGAVSVKARLCDSE